MSSGPPPGPPLGLLFALAAMCALCSSSSAAAGWFTFMGGSGSVGPGSSNNSNTPAGPAAGSTAGPTAGPAAPPAQPDFTEAFDDRMGGDLGPSETDKTLDYCKTACKANADCVGISYNPTTKTCYQKGTVGLQTPYTANNGFKFYYKNIPKYEIKGSGDRSGGDITGMPVTKETLADCAAVCNSDTTCVGISYHSNDNVCYAKKTEGLAAAYAATGYQFYDKK